MTSSLSGSRRTSCTPGARELIYYLGAVMVLPDAPVPGQRLTETLAPYRAFTREYRSRRSGRLRDVLLGLKPWYTAGVLQIIGNNAILRAPALRTLREQCCDQHQLERDPEPDVFRAYSPLPEPAVPPGAIDGGVGGGVGKEGVGEAVEQLVIGEAVLRIRDWGIEADQAPLLLDLIAASRNDYERPARPAMYRPVAGVNLNRLDGRPEQYQDDDARWARMIGTAKTWQENNATVWREVEATIVSHFPTFRFPATGHTGAVDAFYRLHQDLLAIDPYYRQRLYSVPQYPMIGRSPHES